MLAAAATTVTIGVTAAPFDAQARTRTMTAKPDRIDVHAHFVPDFYAQALRDAGINHPDGFPFIPEWSAETALETMDALGVQTAILSISSPGVHFGEDAKARDLARRVNDEGRRVCEAHPTRFGHFAALPLPDVEGTLAEIAYAYDTLKVDGVLLETNHNGVYLGDPKLEPVFAELDRRNAVILIHPTSPACSCSQRLHDIFPQPTLEFMFESTRSVTDMVAAGVLERYPNLRVIVPHAGAALPVLMDRIELMTPLFRTGRDGQTPSIRQAMKTLHFDIAGSPVPTLLEALLKVADPEKIHYGSDYPFTPAMACRYLLGRFEGAEGIDAELKQKIFRTNALQLFPRFVEG